MRIFKMRILENGMLEDFLPSSSLNVNIDIYKIHIISILQDYKKNKLLKLYKKPKYACNSLIKLPQISTSYGETTMYQTKPLHYNYLKCNLFIFNTKIYQIHN